MSYYYRRNRRGRFRPAPEPEVEKVGWYVVPDPSADFFQQERAANRDLAAMSADDLADERAKLRRAVRAYDPAAHRVFVNLDPAVEFDKWAQRRLAEIERLTNPLAFI